MVNVICRHNDRRLNLMLNHDWRFAAIQHESSQPGLKHVSTFTQSRQKTIVMNQQLSIDTSFITRFDLPSPVSQMTPQSAKAICEPQFMPTRQIYDIRARRAEGQMEQLMVDIDARMHGTFTLVDGVVTGYRRNYIKAGASFSLRDQSSGSWDGSDCYMILNDDSDNQLLRIDEFMIRLSAKKSSVFVDPHVDIFMHLPLEQPIVPPMTVIRPSIEPTPRRLEIAMLQGHPRLPKNTDMQSTENLRGRRPSIMTDDQHQDCVIFDRLQFKQSTANNGKRADIQQYFYLKLEVIARLEDGRIFPIAETVSDSLIIRGRSPGHFAITDKQVSSPMKHHDFATGGLFITTDDVSPVMRTLPSPITTKSQPFKYVSPTVGGRIRSKTHTGGRPVTQLLPNSPNLSRLQTRRRPSFCSTEVISAGLLEDYKSTMSDVEDKMSIQSKTTKNILQTLMPTSPVLTHAFNNMLLLERDNLLAVQTSNNEMMNVDLNGEDREDWDLLSPMLTFTNPSSFASTTSALQEALNDDLLGDIINDSISDLNMTAARSTVDGNFLHKSFTGSDRRSDETVNYSDYLTYSPEQREI